MLGSLCILLADHSLLSIPLDDQFVSDEASKYHWSLAQICGLLDWWFLVLPSVKNTCISADCYRACKSQFKAAVCRTPQHSGALGPFAIFRLS